jgi:hypothetical protein
MHANERESKQREQDFFIGFRNLAGEDAGASARMFRRLSAEC